MLYKSNVCVAYIINKINVKVQVHVNIQPLAHRPTCTPYMEFCIYPLDARPLQGYLQQYVAGAHVYTPGPSCSKVD